MTIEEQLAEIKERLAIVYEILNDDVGDYPVNAYFQAFPEIDAALGCRDLFLKGGKCKQCAQEGFF